MMEGADTDSARLSAASVEVRMELAQIWNQSGDGRLPTLVDETGLSSAGELGSAVAVAVQKCHHEAVDRDELGWMNLKPIFEDEEWWDCGEDLDAPKKVWSEGSAVRKAGSDQTELLFPDKRQSRHDECTRKRELRSMLQRAQELDLAFLVDSTGSMFSVIDKVKNLIPNIVTDVKKEFPKLKLRAAFAPYRDYEEYSQDEAEKCDFTDSFQGPQSVFVKAVAKVRAVGGGDPAEDVFSGLERAASLSWSSKTRVLVHIGDSPCHGKNFHNPRKVVIDNHPCGDKKCRDLTKLLEALRSDCQIGYYLFCHVNDTTKTMLTVFRKKAPQGSSWIQEVELRNVHNLLSVVVSASCSSIASSTRLVGDGSSVLKYVPVAWENAKPQWSNITWRSAVQFNYILPATLESLFKIVDYNASLVLEQTPAPLVKISPMPFTDAGSVRWPYHAQMHSNSMWKSPKKMVVKRFKDLLGEDVRKTHTIEAYCEQMEVQAVAAFMAEHFNRELQTLSGLQDYKTVEFTAVSVLQVGYCTFYNLEKWLPGKWIRYSNNVNYVNTREYADTLHAFSHWTYQRSDGLLMVTDLQGVHLSKCGKGKKRNVFMLCDPAVHCRHVYRYARTKTNWSTPGMDSFFENHECNHICRSLKLRPQTKTFY